MAITVPIHPPSPYTPAPARPYLLAYLLAYSLTLPSFAQFLFALQLTRELVSSRAQYEAQEARLCSVEAQLEESNASYAELLGLLTNRVPTNAMHAMHAMHASSDVHALNARAETCALCVPQVPTNDDDEPNDREHQIEPPPAATIPTEMLGKPEPVLKLALSTHHADWSAAVRMWGPACSPTLPYLTSPDLA